MIIFGCYMLKLGLSECTQQATVGLAIVHPGALDFEVTR